MGLKLISIFKLLLPMRRASQNFSKNKVSFAGLVGNVHHTAVLADVARLLLRANSTEKYKRQKLMELHRVVPGVH